MTPHTGRADIKGLLYPRFQNRTPRIYNPADFFKKPITKPNTMDITVAVTDDHPLIVQGIGSMLHDHPFIRLIFSAASGTELLNKLKTQLPEILLLDIQLPDIPGDDLAKLITEKHPEIRIIALTNLDLTFYVRNMFMNGVKGYLLKSTSSVNLVTAIEAVTRGQQYIDTSLRDQMAFEMAELHHLHQKPMLTKREKQILDQIANEQTNAEIAKALKISISTVENHRINIFIKFGVRNVAGLIRKALQMGYIK